VIAKKQVKTGTEAKIIECFMPGMRNSQSKRLAQAESIRSIELSSNACLICTASPTRLSPECVNERPPELHESVVDSRQERTRMSSTHRRNHLVAAQIRILLAAAGLLVYSTVYAQQPTATQRSPQNSELAPAHANVDCSPL
jgi:hypothetical protein